MYNYQLDCCQEPVVVQRCGSHGRLGCVCVCVCKPIFDMSVWWMHVGVGVRRRLSDCTAEAVEHAAVAVKYRTLFNLMLQSLAGVLVSFVS